MVPCPQGMCFIDAREKMQHNDASKICNNCGQGLYWRMRMNSFFFFSKLVKLDGR
eukprot:c36356_g1_i1 orf=88-252(+)